MIACCQVLGQIGEAAGVEPLVNILREKGSFFRRKRRNPRVRAAAAFALGQIHHPRIPEILQSFVDDPNPPVRAIARTWANVSNYPSSKEEGAAER